MMRARFATGIAGLVFAVAAIASNDKRIAWAAIGMLAASLVLRLIARRRDA